MFASLQAERTCVIMQLMTLGICGRRLFRRMTKEARIQQFLQSRKRPGFFEEETLGRYKGRKGCCT